MPTMLVSMKDAGLSIDRSTCVSAAEFTTGGRAGAQLNTRATRVAIGDIRADEGDSRIGAAPFEIEQAPGVGQLVDDDEPIGGVLEERGGRNSTR